LPKGGLEPPRVTSHAPQTCASTSSATSAQFGQDIYYLLFDGAGDGIKTVDVGTAAGAAADGDACGVGVAAGGSGIPDCRTELVPVMNGSERQSASTMKAAAAPIVTFPKMLCVPRGPNAVLDTELENRAPASAFPGCNKIVSTRMMQARMNNP
jgi:hypothetical protein